MRSLFAMLMAAAVIVGCNEQKPISVDSGTDAMLDIEIVDLLRSDVSRRDLPPPDVAQTDGPGSFRDFVFSKITLPTPSTTSQIGHDFDGNGTIDNALGSILGALTGVSSSLNLQQAMDLSVNSGGTLILLRIDAASIINDPGAKAHTWLGAKKACCSTPLSPAQCAAEAQQKCFNGTTTFTPDPSDPAGAKHAGKISAGKMLFGPTDMKFILPLNAVGTLKINLKQAYIKGTLSGNTITGGVLAGAIPKSDIQTVIVPAVATMLDNTLKDPTVDKQTKNTLQALFDANKDGTISAAELANNSLIKVLLSGDLDVDSDGVNELSIGLGFDVAGAVIKP